MAIIVVSAPDYWWRDDPAQFPRTTWHAVPVDSPWESRLPAGQTICGFGPHGARLVTQMGKEIACPKCLDLIRKRGGEITETVIDLRPTTAFV